jgi:hypothetical protein
VFYLDNLINHHTAIIEALTHIVCACDTRQAQLLQHGIESLNEEQRSILVMLQRRAKQLNAHASTQRDGTPKLRNVVQGYCSLEDMATRISKQLDCSSSSSSSSSSSTSNSKSNGCKPLTGSVSVSSSDSSAFDHTAADRPPCTYCTADGETFE